MDDMNKKSASPGFHPTQAQMAGFDAHISAAPFKIAGERKTELLNDIFHGDPWTLEFNTSLHPEDNTFRAKPTSKVIEVNYAALASLWAIAKAAWLIAREGVAANRAGETELPTGPGTPVSEARNLVDTARKLISNAGARWPTDLATPNPDAEDNTEDSFLNNVFLGAVGWVILHEIAHIHLGHQGTVNSDVSFDQEHQADLWAARWVLEKVPAGDVCGYFRVFAISAAMIWLAVLDDVRRGSTTHPHAWQRLGKLAEALPRDELNPGYEMASYVLKVVFLFEQNIPAAEHPEAAFFELLAQANRLPR